MSATTSDPISIGAKAGGNRRVLVMLGVAVALIAAVMVLPGLLFSSGGGGAGAPVSDVSVPGAGLSPTTTVAIDPAASGPVPATSASASKARNPFTPLVASGAASSAPAPAASAPTDPIVAVPVDGFVAPVDPSLDPMLDPSLTVQPLVPGIWETTPPVQAAPAPQPNRVALREVYTDTANRVVASIRVNDITYVVGAGDGFALGYRVVSLDPQTRCAQLLSGDKPFSLCEGNETFT